MSTESHSPTHTRRSVLKATVGVGVASAIGVQTAAAEEYEPPYLNLDDNTDRPASGATAASADIVVAADGSGEYTTVSNAVTAATDGDIVYIKAGDYTISNVTITGDAVEIVGAGADQVTVTVESTGFVQDAQYVAYRNLRFEGSGTSAQFITHATRDWTTIISGCYIGSSDAINIYTEYGHYLFADNNYWADTGGEPTWTTDTEASGELAGWGNQDTAATQWYTDEAMTTLSDGSSTWSDLAYDVTLAIEDADGNSVEGATATLTPSDGSTTTERTSTAEGKAVFSQQSTGTYDVTIDVDWHETVETSLAVDSSEVVRTVRLDGRPPASKGLLDRLFGASDSDGFWSNLFGASDSDGGFLDSLFKALGF